MTTVTTERHYSLVSYNTVLRASPGETDAVCQVEGSLPEALVGGVYYLNGPGLMELDGRLMHPFDAHGFLRAIRFDGPQEARLRSRFVQTDAYQVESSAGTLQYRGIGTKLDSWLENLRAPVGKNVSNTCIVPWAGRLLSLWEGGRPYLLDPDSLATQGVEDLGGALPKEVPILAHTRYDAARERLVLCSISMGRNTGLRFFELDAKGKIIQTCEAQSEGMTLLHDFLMTPHFYVIMVNPVMPQLGAFLKHKAGMASLMEALRMDQRPTQVLLVPRDGSGKTRTFTLDRALFSFHHADAREVLDAQGKPTEVIFHTCAFAKPFAFGGEFGYHGTRAPLDPGMPDATASQQLLRISMELESGTVSRRAISAWSFDFPRVHPDRDGLPCRYFYAGTTEHEGINSPMTAMAKMDLDAETLALWVPGDGQFVGEPVFAARPGADGEDDGWVLVMIYDGVAKHSSLCVLDAGDVAAGPIARIKMPHLLPYGFHGNWSGAGDPQRLPADA